MIKTRLCALAVLLAAPGLLFLPIGAAQAKRPPLSIAVVNVGKLLKDSKAMKAVREKAKKIQRGFKADYADSVKQLQKDEQDLRKRQPVITGREFERQRQDLTRRYVDLRRKSQAQARLLNQAYQKALAHFREEVVIVVKALAVEQGYTMVLNEATMIHVAPQYDITDTVLARINKRLPKIDFKVEGVSTRNTKPKAKHERRSKKKK